MAVTGIVTCNTCDNFILPGDVVTFITKGILIGVNEAGGTNIGEAPESPVLHFCEECAQGLAADMRSLIESVTPQPDEDPDEGCIAQQDCLGCNDCAADEEEEKDEADEFDRPAGSYEGMEADALTCTNSNACCPSCAKPDRCCMGFKKPEDPNYLGFGVTKAEYIAACQRAGLGAHAGDAESGSNHCTPDECSFADRIREALRSR